MIHVETSVKLERRASWGLGAPPPDIRLSFNIYRRQPWIMCTMVQFWCTHLPAHSTRHSSLVQHSPTAATTRFICECSSSQHCLVLCSVQLMHSDELIRIFVPLILLGKSDCQLYLREKWLKSKQNTSICNSLVLLGFKTLLFSSKTEATQF